MKSYKRNKGQTQKVMLKSICSYFFVDKLRFQYYDLTKNFSVIWAIGENFLLLC